MPPILNNWAKVQDGVIDQDTLTVLQSDDIINREFVNTSGQHANLFVAMFRSQRNGKTTHSPKNCLPGAVGCSRQPTIHVRSGFATRSRLIGMSQPRAKSKPSSFTGINRAIALWRPNIGPNFTLLKMPFDTIAPTRRSSK